jgi:formiminotetrahydrofolate cyclodeaminase
VASLEYYLETLASAQPTPGGGSAATIVAAMAASLVAMVARITADNPKFVEHLAEASIIVIHADGLRGKLLDARVADERAYGAVVEAMALPRVTDEEKSARTAQLQATLAVAASVPLEAAATTLSVLGLATRVRAFGNASVPQRSRAPRSKRAPRTCASITHSSKMRNSSPHKSATSNASNATRARSIAKRAERNA